MFCWEVKVAAAYGTSHKVGTVCAASKLGGQKDGNEYCSPVIRLPSEAVEGVWWAPTRFLHGEAEVLWEETTTCTIGAAGVWFWHLRKVSQR